MPKFIAVHTLKFNEEQFIDQAKDIISKSKIKDYKWLRTHCAFDDNKFFCEWEAPSKEGLEQAFKNINFPYDAVYSVKIFNVAKNRME